MTNDPKQPNINLTISGKVNNFADIKPKFVRFNGEAGEKLALDVSITEEAEYPFIIKKVKAKNNQFIKFTLSEPAKGTPKKYLLHVENTKKDPGRYADAIEIQTDSKIQPVITIGVYGYIRKKSPQKADK